MLVIEPMLYEQLAALLMDSINGKDFYSDEITFEQDSVEYRFTATLIIYYREQRYPEGYFAHLSNIAPVWWEFHSTCSDGEVINDFDFELLKRLICN